MTQGGTSPPSGYRSCRYSSRGAPRAPGAAPLTATTARSSTNRRCTGTMASRAASSVNHAARSTSGNSAWRARARRPLHGEGVAGDDLGVAVVLHRPGEDELVTVRLDAAQGLEGPLGLQPRLLARLAAGDGQQIGARGPVARLGRRRGGRLRAELARLGQSLGDAPRPGVLLGPVRAAGVHQQHLDPACAGLRVRDPAVEQQSCADGRHAPRIRYGAGPARVAPPAPAGPASQLASTAENTHHASSDLAVRLRMM